MPVVTLAKLRRIAKVANRVLPCFKWEALSCKEVDALGFFDPPCAAILGEAKLLKVKISIAVDGETAVEDSYFDLDLSATPGIVVQHLAERLREGNPVTG